MTLYPVVVAPVAGFGPVKWDGVQGATALVVLNCTHLFLKVSGDTGQLIDIIPPYTRAEIWLDGFGYTNVQVSDAGLGAVTAPAGLTGNTIYLGTDKGGRSFQTAFVVGAWT